MQKFIKFIKILFILLSLTSILLLSITYLIETEYSKNLITKIINSKINGEFEFKKISFSIFHGFFRLEGLKILNKTKETVISLDECLIDIKVKDLFNKNLVISTLIIETPQFNYKIDEKGISNLVEIFSSSSKPSKKEDKKKAGSSILKNLPFNLIVNETYIINGGAVFNKKNLFSYIKGLKLFLEGNLKKKEANLLISIDEIDFKINNISLNGALFSNLTLLNDSLNIFLKNSVKESTILLKGKVENIFSKPLFSINLLTSTSLEEINEILSLNLDFKGKIESEFDINGDFNNPEFTGKVEITNGKFKRYESEKIIIELKSENKDIEIKNLELYGFGGKLKGNIKIDSHKIFKGGSFGIDKEKLQDLSYSILLNVEGVKIETVLFAILGYSNFPSVALKGPLFLKVSGEGKGIYPANKIKVYADILLESDKNKFTFNNKPFYFSFKANKSSFEDFLILVKSFNLTTNSDFKIDGTYLYSIKKREMEGKLEFKSSNLNNLLSLINLQGFAGTSILNASIKGKDKNPQITAEFKGDNLSYKDISIGSLSLKSSYFNKKVELKSLEINNNGSNVKSFGNITFSPKFKDSKFEIKLDLTNCNLKNFLPNFPFNGVLDILVSGEGSIINPYIKANIQGENFIYEKENKKIYLEDFSIISKFDSGNIIIENFSLNNRESKLNVTGLVSLFIPYTYKLNKYPEIDLKMEIPILKVEDILREYPIKGEILGSFNIVKNEGEIKLSVNNIITPFQKIDNLNIYALLYERSLNIKSLLIHLNKDEIIKGEGFVDLNKNYNIDLSTPKIKLSTLLNNDILDGNISFNIKGEGNFLTNPSLKGQILLSSLNWKETSLNDSKIDFEIKDNIGQLNGNIIGNEIFLSGRANLLNKDFSSEVKFDNTSLDFLLNILGFKNSTGKILGICKAEGNLLNIKEKVSASLNIQNIDINLNGNNIKNNKNIDILFDKNGLVLKEFNISLPYNGFIKGEGGLNNEGKLDFNIKGEGNTKIIPLLISDVKDCSGKVNLHVIVSGELKTPNLQGEINIINVEMDIIPLKQKVTKFNGKIYFDEGKIKFKKVEGRIDEGYFGIEDESFITLDNFIPKYFNIKGYGNNLSMSIPDIMRISLDSNFSLNGTLDEPNILGKVVIIDGIYKKDINLYPTKNIIKKTRSVEPIKKIENKFLKNLNLSFNIHNRNPILVKNNIANIEVNTDLNITGKIENLVADGRVNISYGTVNFQGRDFVVKKGTIDFLNPYKIEPTIDIESETSIRNCNIILKLSGPHNNIEFSLSASTNRSLENSDSLRCESLQHTDIITLITLGKTNKELADKEGASSSASPEQLLAQLISTSLSSNIKKLTGLDIFEIETVESDRSQEEGEINDSSNREVNTKVTIGKQLTKRLTLKYSITSGKKVVQKATAEYKLTDNILVTGSQESGEKYSTDIRYRIESRELFPW